jgi:DNA-binding NarL/FixJ family response regulator
MTKPLRVLMAAWDELFEQLFRQVIEGGGHHVAILNPWKKEQAFLDEARTGGYDVVILTNTLPLDFSLGLIAPLRQVCSAAVIVMSGVVDQVDRERAIRKVPSPSTNSSCQSTRSWRPSKRRHEAPPEMTAGSSTPAAAPGRTAGRIEAGG